ncbi:integrase catalytic domain-containing protein, partial [Mycobacterium kansasii]
NFIRHAILYRHGIPKRIITDNGTPFKNRGVETLCQKYGIHQSFSTPYYPLANGLAEAFNKTIVKFLKKMVSENKHDWDEKCRRLYGPTKQHI